MKVVLFMAMSLNGMIADKDGNEDFLSHANWKSFGKIAKEHGCIIIGRKAYEIVQQWTDYTYSDIDAKLKIVVSSDDNLKLDPAFVLASSPVDAIAKAEAANFESALLVGGSGINSAFMYENLIDEIVFNIEPAIVGRGIPVFFESNFEKRLTLLSSEKIDDGILQVRYKAGI
jgi:dihydrofolate reductase